MLAVIHQVPNSPSKGMLLVGGRPLIDRQIEWLRDIGCTLVIVEIAHDDVAGDAVACWLSDQEHEDIAVEIVRTEHPVGPREVASRAGIRASLPVLAIPSDMIGEVELGTMFSLENAGGVVACFTPPPSHARVLQGGTVRLVRAPIRVRQPLVFQGPGWAVRLQDERDARAVGALLEEPPPSAPALS